MYTDKEDNEEEYNVVIDLFNLLPQDCIATVISSTTPRDACRIAAVSKVFKSAADSDDVWLRFMPSDLADVIARSDDDGCHLFDSMTTKELFFLLSHHPLLIDGVLLSNKFDNADDFVHSISKKDLFFLLFQHPPLFIDGGTKSVSLDRLTGKKCCSISARDLNITWSDSPKYWQWRSVSESRFSEVAELISVCWFELHGKVRASLLSQDTNYVAYFVFKTTDATYGFNTPAEVSIRIDGRKKKKRNVYLDEQEVQNRRLIVPRRRRVFHQIQPPTTTFMQTAMKQQRDRDQKILPRKRDDGWMEVEVGEFFLPRRNRNETNWEMEMSVLEIDSGIWKGGLIVEGFDIRPKVL